MCTTTPGSPRNFLTVLFGLCVLVTNFFFFLTSSLSYEEGHPSQSEPDLLQRQSFGASHQLPGYAPTPQPTGNSACGVYCEPRHIE